MNVYEQLPRPTILIPSLTMSYDVVQDELALSLNGAPLRGPVTNSLALRKRCADITTVIVALIRGGVPMGDIVEQDKDELIMVLRAQVRDLEEELALYKVKDTPSVVSVPPWTPESGYKQSDTYPPHVEGTPQP